MKKLILLCLSLLPVLGFSQISFQIKNYNTGQVVAPNATINIATTAWTNFKVVFDVKNTGAGTATYTARRYDVLLNTRAVGTSSAYFCFGGNCYGVGTYVSPNNLVLNSNQSASDISADKDSYFMLTADLDEIDPIGYSIIKYTFTNISNVNDSMQLTLKYNDINVGIKENGTPGTKLEVYPNPSPDGNIGIKSNLEFSSQVEVINQLGEVILIKKASSLNGMVNLDLSSVPPGIYYLKIASGPTSLTKKLVITNN